MKAKFLKIAGVKTEKEFYKKYPTEAAFFKAHPEAKASIKKAQIGAYIGGDVVDNPEMVNYRSEYDAIDKMITGYTDAERRAAAEKAAAAKQSGDGGGFDISSIMSMFGGSGESGGGGGSVGEGIMSSGGFGAIGGGIGGARHGKHIPRAYVGAELPEWAVDAAETATDTTTIAPTFDVNKFGISAQTRLPRTNTPMQQPQVASTNNTGFGGVNYSGPPVYSPIPDGDPNGPGGIMGKNTSGAPYAPGSVTQSNDYAMGEVNPQASGGGFNVMSAIPVVGGIIGGIQALGAQKEAKRAAKQAKKVSDITLAASATRPEETKRRYVTPWDNPVQPGQMFPSYGVGTNPLARDGVRLQGGGEIQNTYAPDYLYDDLGYEPLNDSNIKQYYDGGDIPVAEEGMQWGVLSKGGAGFGENPYGGLVSSIMGNNNAGSQIGGAIGSAFGPVGGIVGSAFGGMLDTDQADIDKYNKGTRQNMEGMTINNMIPGMHAGHRGHLKDGGYMNPNYNPQVITMFGDVNAQDFADYAHKYRAGGHLKSYTEPSERAMETYAMGGQLKTHWGGKAETMSYNPYMPGSGETVLFRGQSHTESDKKGNTGIGITYGESPVEVERGEPMFEMQSGGEVNPETGEPENTGVVFGNMSIDKKVASKLNDPELMEIANKYHGKKFKNIGIALAKQEAKQNKIIDKNTKILDSFKVQTSLDKAKLAALQANMEGADTKLKNIANTKITLANYQNAINDTRDELSDVVGKNLSAEDLARGYVKLDKDPVTMNAKWGGNIIKKAQTGTTLKSYPNDEAAKADGFTWTGEYKSDGKTKIYQKTIKTQSKVDSEAKAADALGYIPAGQKQSASGLWGKVTQEQFEAAKKANPWFDWSNFNPKNKADVKNYQRAFNARAKALGSSAEIKDDGDFGEQTVSARIDESKKSTPSETQEVVRATVEGPGETPMPEGKSKTPWWAIAANTLLPYFRPTDQEAFDYAQLYPEMYAMATNQLEPVPVQGYRPDLGTPYDISYQDMLNANQADYNASQKMVGYNPAAQSILNAQKYAANEKVLGEQFRANQAMQSGVYNQNRQVLNDAKLKNLDIFDRQYGRQAEAKSNTKATTQAALNSMADKYAKHKLENRTLGVYENMYNYRFDKNGRAQNYNPLQIFDTEMGGGKSKNDGDIPGLEATRWDRNGNPIAWRKASDKKTVADDDLESAGGIQNKNGGYTKIKSSNGSILRDFKNL
jgi:hypothetical protein